MMGKTPRGAAAITRGINQYGGNKGMVAGLKKFASDNQNIGYQRAVSDMQRTSVLKQFFNGGFKLFGK